MIGQELTADKLVGCLEQHTDTECLVNLLLKFFASQNKNLHYHPLILFLHHIDKDLQDSIISCPEY